MKEDTEMKPWDITDALSDEIGNLQFNPPVTFVYNPLEYARHCHNQYLQKYGDSQKEAIFVGMNPGPFGMAQTGVPFGDVVSVRQWLQIDGPIGKPEKEHPNRPIQGFDCPRREVSGTRVWEWAKELFGTPDHFFARFMVLNYCPLCFLEDSGRNRTPDKLPKHERARLFDACDRALHQLIRYYQPTRVIGVGAFAEDRVKSVAKDLPVQVSRILHPSPASPLANRGWAQQATAQLQQSGIELP